MKREGCCNFFRLLFLVLFMSFQTSNIFFFHAHNIEGHLVAHSHPYKACEHCHTTNDILLFQSFSILTVPFDNAFSIDIPYIYSEAEYPRQLTAGFLPSKHFCSSSLRAPPAFAQHTV